MLTLDDATVAATGDSLVLGRTSRAGATTVLQTTGNGPALSLRTRPGRAPLAVSFDNVTEFGYAVPAMPAGDYLFTINGWLYSSARAPLSCGLVDSDVDQQFRAST